MATGHVPCKLVQPMFPELTAITLGLDPRLAKDHLLPDTGDMVCARYRVRKLIGFGGMSAVYVAEDELLGRDVALKVLYPKLRAADDQVARFMKEACTLAQLSSRHIVGIYDTGFTACGGAVDLPFMALELLSGRDLWSVLRERGTLGVPLAVRYTLDVCEGVAHAHARGIVHRDLKPENLFVAQQDDGSECVKVFDFGIAKAPRVKGRRHLTRQGESMGSPHYMSPEQLLAPREVDARSDVWAIGAVLYELVTGKVPFDGATPLDICSRIISTRAPSAAEHDSSLPRPLLAVLERCLERERNARFGDVAELYAALAPLAQCEVDTHAQRAARLERLVGREQDLPLLLRRRRTSSIPDAPPGFETARALPTIGRVARFRRWLSSVRP
jgi:eukaryotic-like serine/threonine-protein kinase